MNNTLFIESDAINSYPEFIDGFLKTAYWTTKEEDNADVIVRIRRDNLDLTKGSYIVEISKKNEDDFSLEQLSLHNESLTASLYYVQINSALAELIYNEQESKRLKELQSYVDKHNMSDFEFGQYISAIISDALIEDKIRSGAV